MNWLLEQVQPDSTMGMTASVDFFDGFGVILLHKGQLITEGIRDLLQKRRSFCLEKTGKHKLSG